MGSSDPYSETYPRAGDVALLCEGDVIGYESSILAKWADLKLGTRPLVDVWPCGTGAALFGLSDALGRSRPLMVIEDRDFRTAEEAARDCKEFKKKRTDREVQIIDWRVWRRNEIENYLIEPVTLLPVMADAFATTEGNVQATLAEVLSSLAVFQSVQYALYRVRRAWNKTDPSPILPQANFYPIWRDSEKKATAPPFEAVKAELNENLQRWRERFVSRNEPPEELQGKDFIQELEARYELWRRVTLEDPAWRLDWSGKDVMQWLRIALTARFGWRDSATGARQPLSWEQLNRSKRDKQDRPVEAALKPLLVTLFLKHLSQSQGSDIHAEWEEMVSMLRRVSATDIAMPVG
jgi:hypothetical protein